MIQTKEKGFGTPILLLVFNRPNTTKQVFDVIRKLRPRQLFIAADGPRQTVLEDRNRCAEVRKIVENIDWQCKVKRMFQEKNLGCRLAPPTAIDWFFDNVEEGIILEDDCIPNFSFFRFCKEMLEYYRNDEKVATISGGNVQPIQTKKETSYRFSIYPLLWGWATWKRVWLKHDIDMRLYPDFVKQDKISHTKQNKIAKKYWLELFDKSYRKLLNTWDYPLLYSIWNSNGLSIIPSKNMVRNIGFSKDATHTTNPNHPLKTLDVQEMQFPIVHPLSKIPNRRKDKKLFYYALARHLAPYKRFKRYIRKILERLRLL